MSMHNFKEYLSVQTESESFRSEIVGWNSIVSGLAIYLKERSRDGYDSKKIGQVSDSEENPIKYRRILEVLADGWELLSPPLIRWRIQDKEKIKEVDWMFVRHASPLKYERNCK